ncbi:hypothetical protein DTO212C5_2219 [Paecilomyces variotii]|nr:hypothetical protein DTO212C5_2219 [Paecilomyces variotii]
MASISGARDESQLPPAEAALLELAGNDRRDALSLSDKESLTLRLYDQILEQELERALLEQDVQEASDDDDVEQQIAIAERELLEARATYSVRKKAVEAVLMTDPSLKAVHLKAVSPAERALLPLIHRRDVLALVHENLAAAHTEILEALSNAEVDNRQITEKNQRLFRTLLELTDQESSWKEEITDPKLRAQLQELEAGHKKSRARWETIKGIASAVVVASGVDWARDDALRELVLDESDD